MHRLSLIMALLLATAVPAFAAPWAEVVKGINRSTSYIDTGSLQRHGHSVTVWSKHLFDQPQTVPGLGTFNEMRIRQTIDCQAKTSAHLRVDLYNRGKEVRSETADPSQAKPILPGGIADMTRRAVCKNIYPG